MTITEFLDLEPELQLLALSLAARHTEVGEELNMSETAVRRLRKMLRRTGVQVRNLTETKINQATGEEKTFRLHWTRDEHDYLSLVRIPVDNI